MRIVICGVGALGSTAAWFARNLDATLRLVDFDRVESKNLLAQTYVKQSVGKNKAKALQLQLSNFHGLEAEAFAVRLTEQNTSELLGDADLVVDCVDNIATRTIISGFAREHGKACVHAAVAADGTYGMIRWDDQFVPDAEDQTGQATCEGGEHLPIIGLIGSTLARTLQEFHSDGRRINSMISLSGVSRT